MFAIKQLVGHGLTPTAAAAGLIGVVTAVLFVRRQRRVPFPLIDVRLFANRAFSGALASQLVALIALVGLLFFLSQYLQLVRGHTALEAGLPEMPLMLASMAVVLVVGRVVARLGLGRAIGAGLAVSVLGMLALAGAEALDGYGWLAVSLVLVGCGIGLAFTLRTDAAVSAVEPHRAGTASALSETSYEPGAALGVALLGSLQTVLYRIDLPEQVARPDGGAIRESLARAAEVLTGAELHAARESFTWAMQVTAIAAAVLLAVAAATAWRVIPSTRRRSSVH